MDFIEGNAPYVQASPYSNIWKYGVDIFDDKVDYKFAVAHRDADKSLIVPYKIFKVNNKYYYSYMTDSIAYFGLRDYGVINSSTIVAGWYLIQNSASTIDSYSYYNWSLPDLYTSHYNNNLIGLTNFSSHSEAINAIWNTFSYSITYRLTNCTAPNAPTKAKVGDTVTVPLVLQEGYDFITPSTDILVTNNGKPVEHTYSNGTLTFTMPDPDSSS